jgi:hypothetical protein
VASRVAAAVKAKFTTVQTPEASTLRAKVEALPRYHRVPRSVALARLTLTRSCDLHAARLAHPLEPHMGILAACGGVGPAHDFPLACRIGRGRRAGAASGSEGGRRLVGT